jgi:hypothetical protein
MAVRRFALALPLAFFLMFPTSLSSQATPSTTVSAGTKLGTFIRDAIAAALPEVSSLVKTLFPKTDSSKEKDDKQTTSKADVSKAASEQANAAKAKSDAELVKIKAISDELGVISKFLDKTVPASQQGTELLAHLDGAKSIPNTFRKQWDKYYDDYLTKIFSNVTPTDLSSVDEGLQLTLSQVRNLGNTPTRDQLDASIDEGDLSGVRSQLRGISALLNSVVTIGGIEIESLHSSLAPLTADPNQKKQGIGDQENPILTRFNSALNADVRTYKLSLPAKKSRP